MPFVGGARPKAKLKYERQFYTPMGAKELDEKDLRKEYVRLRAIAQKRIGRLLDSEWKDSQIALENKRGFKTLGEIKSDSELRHELSDLARFVTSERGSVAGQNKIRKETVKSLQERGYDFVNVKNFRDFAEFMEYARTANMGKLYASEQVAELFETEEKKDSTPEEMQNSFNEWQEKQRLESKVQNKKKRGSKQFRKALE